MTFISRRHALLAACGLAVGSAGVFGYVWLSRNVESIIEANLDFLTIAPGSIEEFATAFRDAFPARATHINRVISNPEIAIERLRQMDISKADRMVAESICTTFLLSSDFFGNSEDYTKPVKFVALAEPHQNAAFNTLARFE